LLLRNFQFGGILPLSRLEEKYSPVNDDGCFGNAGLEQLGELLRNYRPAEIVALRFVTLVSLKKFQLLLRFHALRNDSQLQASAHADHGGHDGGPVGSGGDLTDEGLVDFGASIGDFLR